jgi:hypothetical protein
VKLHLLKELMDLNHAFETVIRGLERMGEVTLFDKEHIRYTRAEVEGARVEAKINFSLRYASEMFVVGTDLYDAKTGD